MNPIYVIAEMAWSHDGQEALATKIVTDAKAAGANAISIHLTHMPDYMVRHFRTGAGRVSAGHEAKPIFDYLVEINLSDAAWRNVAAVARGTGLDLVVMPNDPKSLVFSRQLDPTAYVLSAACFEELDFIADVANEGKPVYLRVGGATLGEIETVVNLLRKCGNDKVTLLYGHQNYPTEIADTNLGFLSCLMTTFGLPVGIADHVSADDDFAAIAPLLAIPLGISCIEKHITHDRGVKGEDFESALNGDELKLLVERIRKSEQALGLRHALGLDASSANYRKNVRKRLVAAHPLKRGAVIARADILAKRSDDGLFPSDIDLLIGRTLARDLTLDEGLVLEVLEPKL